MRPWLDLFRARLREPADLPTLVHELEQVVRAIIQPRSAALWAPPDVARHWSSPANLPAYAPDDPLIEHFVAHPAVRRAIPSTDEHNQRGRRRQARMRRSPAS